MHSNAITVEADINTSLEKVWELWTKPEHVMNWNNASPDWHCPKATNDLREGGAFSFTMAAKDGSFSFDFGGTYDLVKKNEQINYTMADGRKAEIFFSKNGTGTHIKETFDPESVNSVELQKGGWQSILNNFKAYAEKK